MVSGRILELLDTLGLKKHERKGFWGRGSKVVDHLGVRWGSGKGRFAILERKKGHVRAHARKLIFKVTRGRRWVERKSLRYFVGIMTELSPARPLALIYARSLNDTVTDFAREGMQAARGTREHD